MITSRTRDRLEGERPQFLVFAPSAEDDRFDGQLLCLNDEKEGFIARDLVLVEIVEDGESRAGGEPLSEVTADSLRRRHGAGPDVFLAVLVDRHGREVARWEVPVPPVELLRRVDEIRHR